MVVLPVSLLLLLASSISALLSPAPSPPFVTSSLDPFRALRGPAQLSVNSFPLSADVCSLNEAPALSSQRVPEATPTPPPPLEKDATPTSPSPLPQEDEGHLLPPTSPPPPSVSPTSPAFDLPPPPPPLPPSSSQPRDALPDAAFLSFEEWKALQFARQAASSDSAAATTPSALYSATQARNASDGGRNHVDCSAMGQGCTPSENGTVKDDGRSSVSVIGSTSSSSLSSSSSTPSLKSPSSPPSRRFNYASLDCSARVQ